MTLSDPVINAGTINTTLTLATAGGQSLTFKNDIDDNPNSAPGHLALDGYFPDTGTLNLYGATSTFSGGAIFRAGIIIIDTSLAAASINNALGGGTVSLGDTSPDTGEVYLQLGDGTYTNPFVLEPGTTGQLLVRLKPSAASATLAGGITGTNQNLNLIDNSPGQLIVSGPVNYVGALTAYSLSAASGGDVQILSAIGNEVTSVTVNTNTSSSVSVLVLNGTNTYSGPTIVGGTLVLAGYGSISNSSSINIGAGNAYGGGTLDVSGLAGGIFNLSSLTVLNAVGTTNDNATITGASGGTVNLGSQPVNLTFTPTNFTGDLTHPALSVENAMLELNGNAFTVTNAAATTLGDGLYLLVTNVGSAISSNGTDTVIVAGAGAVSGPTSLEVISSGLYLVVGNPPRWCRSSIAPRSATACSA